MYGTAYPTFRLYQSIVNKEDASTIKNHLEAGIIPKKYLGNTPLILAFKFHPLEEVLQLLIDSGVEDVNTPDICTGWTPLHYAVKYGLLRVIESLVQKGANLNVLCKGSRVPPVLLAANLRKKEVVELLIALGANVDYCSMNKWTLLHYAVGYGWIDMVKALLKKNVDVDAQTVLGDTPLFWVYENEEIAKILIEAGADSLIKNKKNVSPYHYFVKHSNVEGIKAFVQKGGYIEPSSALNMVLMPRLNKGILGDVKVCSQNILNTFNRKVLPALYKIPFCANNLPPVEQMKIGDSSESVKVVEQSVSLIIQRRGYHDCNERCPLVLKMLCVNSILVQHQRELAISSILWLRV